MHEYIRLEKEAGRRGSEEAIDSTCSRAASAVCKEHCCQHVADSQQNTSLRHVHSNAPYILQIWIRVKRGQLAAQINCRVPQSISYPTTSWQSPEPRRLSQSRVAASAGEYMEV